MGRIICLFALFFVSCVSIKQYKRLQFDTESAKTDYTKRSVEIEKLSVEIKSLQNKVNALEASKSKKDSINELIKKTVRRK